MSKYRIHYFNGQIEEIESEETQEALMAQTKPILAVVLLEEKDARKEPSAVQVDEGSGKQPKTRKAKGN